MSRRNEVIALREQGKTYRDIGRELGVSRGAVYHHIKAHRDGRPVGVARERGMLRAEVPNVDLREKVIQAMRENEVSWIALAARCGQTRRRAFDKRSPNSKRGQVGDPARIKRALGVIPTKSSSGRHYFQVGLNYDLALKIVRAAGLDPVDVGL